MSKIKIVIDPIQLGKLAELCCSIEEVAAYFRCSPTTIRYRLTRDPLKTVWETGLARGRISLRRAQLQAAYSGDRTMLIWLGKQLLGQAEKLEQEVKQDQRWVVELPPPMAPDDWVKAFGKPGDGAVDVTNGDGNGDDNAKAKTGRGRRTASVRIVDSTDFSEIDPTKKKAS
jgi:hypothetical protein